MADMSPDAFEALYATHAAYVLSHATRFVGSADAPDVAQLVWMKVFRAFDGFRGDAAVRSWLYQVTLNAARDHRRLALRKTWGHAVTVAAAGHAADIGPSPEWLALTRQQRARVDRVLRTLEPERQAVLLAWLQGMSLVDVAVGLGLPIGTVKSRTYRAMQELTARVQKQSHGKKTATH